MITIEQAKAAAAVVEAYMNQEDAAHPVVRDDDGVVTNIDWDGFDLPHHNLAAMWAHVILDASGRDSWLGCVLCRG